MNNILIDESYGSMLARLYPDDVDMQPLNVTFQVTDDCNLRCSYCYQINKGHHKMPLETAKAFIDLLFDNSETTKMYIDTNTRKSIVLDFIGGEPFLEVKLIDQIVDYFVSQAILRNHPWQYNYRISISSNGTLYFRPEVQNFIKKYQAVLSLGITVDGHKELHDACRVFPDGKGSYDIAIAAVHHYAEVYHGGMSSKVTLAPANIEHTYEALKHLIEEGYTSIHCNCVFEKGWTLEHATCLYYELKKIADYILDNNLADTHTISMFAPNGFHPMSIEDNTNWCGGNGQMIAVDYKGDIYPCLRYMESSLGNEVPPIIIGNVKTGIMQDAKCINCIKALQAVDRLSQSTEECINCSIAQGCSWCQAYNYQDSGDFNHRATYICVMHQATALANSYYWNRYYLQNDQDNRMKLWLEDEKALKIIPIEELAFLRLLQYPVL